MAPNFHLLTVPRHSLLQVVQFLELYQLIIFSLLSKQARSLASLVDTSEIQHININALPTIQIFIHLKNNKQLIYIEISNRSLFIRLETPTRDFFVNSCKKENYTREDWICDLFTVLPQRKVWKLTFGDVEEKFLEGIQKCEELKIKENCPLLLKQRALQVYSKEAKEITVENFLVEKIHSIRNLDYLEINHIPNLNEVNQPILDLDSLLTINSIYFTTVCPSLKILNKFVKLWSRKKTNTRLRHARFLLSNQQFKIKEILAGIPYQESAEIRKFNYPKKDYEKDWEKAHRMIYDFKGGFDFRRCDGTLGTIFWNKMFSRIDFFVWY